MDTTFILNDLEREKIIAFNQDKIMFGAVKKYILAHLYDQGVMRPGVEHDPTINWLFQLGSQAINPSGIPRSDEELGQDLRAKAMGLQIVVSGFKELAEFSKPNPPKEEDKNPAV